MNSRQLAYDVGVILKKEGVKEITIKGVMSYRLVDKPYIMVMDSEGYFFKIGDLKGLYQKYKNIKNDDELSAVYSRLTEFLSLQYGFIGIEFKVKGDK